MKGHQFFTCVRVIYSFLLLALSACAPSPAPTATAELPTPKVALATATRVPPTPVPEGTFLVTSTADSGPGTLRQALIDAESGDVITFDPAVFRPDAPTTIALSSGLPELNQGNLTIDASSAGVILDGSHAPDPTSGLSISSNGNIIRGLQITGFSDAGIGLHGGAQDNVIGGDRNVGGGPLGQGNLISGNGAFGIGLWDESTSHNTIQGNYIGISLDGTATWGHARDGIHSNGATQNLITGNVIGGNESAGVYLCCVLDGGNTLTDNLIGVGPGGEPLANGLAGVLIDRTSHNVVGPGNTIAYNLGDGVALWEDTPGNTVTQNSIRDNGGRGISLLSDRQAALPPPSVLDADFQAGIVTGAACPNCVVEVFSGGGDEGAISEGQAQANGGGEFTFVKGAPLAGPFLTANATAPDGSTTEFSAPAQWLGAAPLPVREEVTFTVQAQLGGPFNPVAIDGNTVFVGIGPRFATVDISDPMSPRLLWQSDVLPGVVSAIAAEPGLAALRAGGDVATEVRAYDVGDPAQPAEVGATSGLNAELYRGPGNVVRGGVLYLATEGTLKLVDPVNSLRVFGQFALGNALSYLVEVQGSTAYVVENWYTGGPDVLRVLDVGDPANVREIATLRMDIGRSLSWMVVTDDTLYLLARTFPHPRCPVSLHIMDITEPASPQGPVQFVPESCFNSFAVAGDILAATSERGLEVYNVGDPANIRLTGVLAPPTGIIAVERVAVDQGLAYLLTTAGLRVLDLASPTPTLLPGDGLELQIEPSIFGGMDVRGDRLFGLGPIPVDISVPGNPRLALGDPGADNKEGAFYWPTPALVENALYTGLLTNTPDGLRIAGGFGIVNVTYPAKPVLVNRVSMEGYTVSAMAAAEGHLIVYSQPRLRIYDIGDPFNPIEVGGLDLPLGEPTLAVAGDTVYLFTPSGDHATLFAVDISDPAHPVVTGHFTHPSHARQMVPVGDTIYLWMAGAGDLRALDVSDRTHPYLSGHFPLPVGGFAVAGDRLYLAAGDGGLLIVRAEK